ncbi:MAG: hypothetical protein IIZ06_07015 [Kiritimatiellae bacterium]|nr:hypothetical protein [Kiritimatiellia bacterium]
MKKALQWICESRVVKTTLTLLAVVLVAVIVFCIFSRGIFDDDDKVIVTDSVDQHAQGEVK